MPAAAGRTRGHGLRFGPIGPRCIHLCVDMQRLFGPESVWTTPSMLTVLPNVLRIVSAHPAETVFTRFVTPARPEQAAGTWRRYYERWRTVTTERLAPGLLDLLEPLGSFAPPAAILDKTTYSPWLDGQLDRFVAVRGTDSVVVTGGETDVCVLGAVLGAVDRGLRTIIVADGLCSSSDRSHDATMALYRDRYDEQVETVATDALLAAWPGSVSAPSPCR